jgi:hypothetical protein
LRTATPARSGADMPAPATIAVTPVRATVGSSRTT